MAMPGLTPSSNLHLALTSIGLTTLLLGFPFPGISIEFIIHRVPMFMMLSSLTAVGIGSFRTSLSEDQRGQLQELTEEMMSHSFRLPDELMPKRSYSTGAIPDGATQDNGLIGFGTLETVRLWPLEKDIFSHMKGPASFKSQSTQSSDVSLPCGLQDPRTSWDLKTRIWFLPTDSSAVRQENYPASRSSSPWRL